MRGENTGRVTSPSSSPRSAGKAPMNSSVIPDPTGKSLRMVSVACKLGKVSVADPPCPFSAGPESSQDQPAADTADIQESKPGASSQPAASSIASAPNASGAAEGADAPKKSHLLFPIPSRRSSKTDKQSTVEGGEQAIQETPSRRGSKVSMLKVRRERSRASSRRSRRAQDLANVEKTQETTTPSTPEMNGPPKPQQKKSSKLLSFLGCCSSSDVDGEDVQPAKKTAMRPPASNRPPTPDKAEAHTGDSSTAESRDPAYFNDEKAPLASSADQPRPLEEEHSQVPADAQGEGISAAGATQPDLPPVSSKEHEGTVVAANGSILGSQTDGAHQTDEQQAAVAEESTGAESTLENPVSSESDNLLREEEVVQTPAVLPPPPPPPPPPAPEILSPPEAGEQQWLLPPPLPHMQNRKCLVLDLDETLVHSSFKVSREKFVGRVDVSTHRDCRFLNAPISPSPWRSKGSITTST